MNPSNENEVSSSMLSLEQKQKQKQKLVLVEDQEANRNQQRQHPTAKASNQNTNNIQESNKVVFHSTNPMHVNHTTSLEDTNIHTHFNDVIEEEEEGEEENEEVNLTIPLVVDGNNEIRSRKRTPSDDDSNSNDQNTSPSNSNKSYPSTTATVYASPINNARREKIRQCCNHVNEIRKNVLRNTITVMNFMARVLFWISLVVTAVGVFWYSKELALHGTDAHLIAWFSAGAFVILGFPISIYGILMHLTNYYQPNVQCYVVRILWMVPIYSIESWLCLRFHKAAIYIETLRDFYESYVLYCFLHFLIEVLGGEESLIMMLKDKSPTRGVHYSPLNWFMKPWVMGQPVSTVDVNTGQRKVKWTSPFFKHCKLGCLQYVLLKFISAVFVMILEHLNLYKEGDFTPKGGYLYICILTNTSQCWALYCLVFFYYATKNELGPIRPVGKFLAVKSLVFFTWWQSLGISLLHEMNFIPSYEAGGWSTEEVARGLQAYLICIEMFVIAVLHIFIFPHTDYLKPMAISRPNEGLRHFKGRRVGRRFNNRRIHTMYKDDCSKTSDSASMYELDSLSKSPLPNNNSDPSFTAVGGNNSTTDQSTFDTSSKQQETQERKGFVQALIDSTLPRDVMDNTIGIAKGDFTVEKKTLLYHAASSDQYSLFKRKWQIAKNKDIEMGGKDLK